MPEYFARTHETLMDIRNKLEKLSLTQAWSLRETDLYDFQRQLDKIDESRVNGNFLDGEGKPTELYVQRVSDQCHMSELLLIYLDLAVSYSKELCIHLLSYGFVGTGLGSSLTCLQSTPNPEALSN